MRNHEVRLKDISRRSWETGHSSGVAVGCPAACRKHSRHMFRVQPTKSSPWSRKGHHLRCHYIPTCTCSPPVVRTSSYIAGAGLPLEVFQEGSVTSEHATSRDNALPGPAQQEREPDAKRFTKRKSIIRRFRMKSPWTATVSQGGVERRWIGP